MTDTPGGPAPHKLLKHGLGFLVSGSLAFITDALVLEFLTIVLDLDPILARIGSISLAMVVGWLSHRRLTFGVAAAPSLPEFGRYAAVAWFSAGVNYLVFVTLLLLLPETSPFAALVIASATAMFVSYFGMRYAAFRVHTSPNS